MDSNIRLFRRVQSESPQGCAAAVAQGADPGAEHLKVDVALHAMDYLKAQSLHSGALRMCVAPINLCRGRDAAKRVRPAIVPPSTLNKLPRA